MRGKNGKFAEGNKGKPKGAQNKKTSKVKGLINDYLQDNYEKFCSELDGLEGKEYADTYLKLMEYSLPKLQRVDSNVLIEKETPELDPSKLSDEELATMLSLTQKARPDED